MCSPFSGIRGARWWLLQSSHVILIACGLTALPCLADITTTGDVHPDPASTTSSDVLYVGDTADGSLSITGGDDAINSTAVLGNTAAATGTVTVEGGGSTWTSSGNLFAGYEGNGSLTITGGATVSVNEAFLGRNPGSFGQVTVSDVHSSFSSSDDIWVGFRSDGSLRIADGATVHCGLATLVGAFVPIGAAGSITFNGGTLNTQDFWAAPSDLFGSGTVNTHGLVSDMDLVFDPTHGPQQQIILSSEPGQNITINLDVDGASALGVGFHGQGSLTIADGVTVQSESGYLGYQPGSIGRATVTGTDTDWTMGLLEIGLLGHGQLEINHGATVHNGFVYLGRYSTGEVTVTGDDSAWLIDGGIYIGGYSSFFPDPAPNAHGILRILDGAVVSSYGAVLGSAPEATGTVTVDGAGSTWTIDSGLTVGGLGTGSLIVTHGGAIEGGQTIIVFNGSEIRGDGYINGNVTNFGLVSPGQSCGTLHLDGTYSQLATGSLAIELADSAHDQLAVTGGAVLDGRLDLLLDAGYLPGLGDSFTILDADSIADAFAFISGVIVQHDLALAVTYSDTQVTVTAALPGDANLDGMVNMADLQVLGDYWGADNAQWAGGDYNGDGRVNLADLQLLGDNWSATAGDFAALSAAIIPEPAAMVVLVMGATMLLRRRRFTA